MEIIDVYVLNVMPWAISGFIGCPVNDVDKINGERASFRNFLVESEKRGINYDSQLSAWSAYKEFEVIYNDPDSFWHLDAEEDDTEVDRYFNDIVDTLYNEANKIIHLANYEPLDTIEKVKNRGIRIRRNTKFSQE